MRAFALQSVDMRFNTFFRVIPKSEKRHLFLPRRSARKTVWRKKLAHLLVESWRIGYFIGVPLFICGKQVVELSSLLVVVAQYNKNLQTECESMCIKTNHNRLECRSNNKISKSFILVPAFPSHRNTKLCSMHV